MQKIIINKTKNEIQIAIIEDEKLVELQIDNDDEIIAGNIYSGVIKTKLKNMEAFFIDIGKEKNGYLAISQEEIKSLKSKENILVQVKKDETEEKGANLTQDISINGRYMVLLPRNKDIMFSKKITSEQKKEELTKLNEKLNEKGYGIIFRNEIQTATAEQITDEYKLLTDKWDNIYRDFHYRKAPVLLSKLSLAENIFNNLVTKDTAKIVVNDEKIYEEIAEFAKAYGNGYTVTLELYEDVKLSIFDFYKIESQIEKALANHVWLKSGGELRIDKTEAMTVIDIDTSKFVGKKNMAETALKTNSEAAAEIARQIRLRNISGIIIIDFINMKSEKDKQDILKILKEETKKDRVTTVVVGMTKLGLVEMTRQKSRKSLDDLYKQECPVCKGKGKIASINMIVNKIENELKYLEKETIYKKVSIEAHELVIKKLSGGNVIKNTKLMTLLKGNKSLMVDEYKITKN